MFSISTEDPETARALMAVQCIMDGQASLCDCPEWLRSAIPVLLRRLRALEAELDDQAASMAVFGGLDETGLAEAPRGGDLLGVPESQRAAPSTCPDDPYDAWAN